jgi:gluconate kinase
VTSPVDDPGAVLVTGVYGAGKSTVVEDIADLLEKRGVPYGVLDVDWLGWFDAGGDEAAHWRVEMANVSSVCRALARSVRDRGQLDAIRVAVPEPMRVVRLEVDAALVERRLSGDPSEARSQDDLHVALEWLAAGHGVGLEDLLLAGDRPVRETSPLRPPLVSCCISAWPQRARSVLFL